MRTTTIASLLVGLLAASVPAIAAEIEVVRNIDYLAGVDYAEERDKLDLYLPAGEEPHPVVVYYYGGALQAGEKSSQSHVGQRFASAGFLVVVPNYRLSPAVQHPAHAEDAAAALAWVHEHIGEYGGDSARIAIAGHSAGGYLVGLLALDGRYLGKHGLDPASHIRAAAPISGFFHVDRVAPARPKTVWGEDPSAWPDDSPSKYVSAQAPPMLCLFADGDVEARRDESRDLVAELESAGNAHASHLEIANRNHGSIARLLNEDGDETSAAIVEFFKKHLR